MSKLSGLVALCGLSLVPSQVLAQLSEPTPLGPVRIPVHSQADDPIGGAYGIWAAGTSYKVSFHDGFTFVPYLGPSYPHNQPFSWRTESVLLGGQPIVDVDVTPDHNSSDYRYEYRFGADFVEAYDVLAEGVEQTFVLNRRPQGDGDLVIEGAITSRMDAMPLTDQHGALTYRDDRGDAIVRYGETAE